MLHKDLAQLLHYTVDSLYGYLPAEVFQALIRHGRLISSDIQRKTGLRSRDVNGALVILVQQHLVRYHSVTNLSRSNGTHYDSTTYYEANWESAYDQTIRAGKILRLVEERYGEPAGGVILNLLRFGHATVADLVGAYGVTERDNDSESLFVNGGSKEQDGGNEKQKMKTLGQLHSTLDILLSAGFIKPVHEVLDYWPEHDKQAHIKSTLKPAELRDGKSVKSKQEEYDSDVRRIQTEWQQESDKYFAKTAVKNTAVNGNGFEGDENDHDDQDSALRLDDKLTLRVNFEKGNVLMRNKFLTRMAERHLGETTSIVYAALLQALDAKILRCIDPFENPLLDDEDQERLSIPVSTLQVLRYIPQNSDLRVGLFEHSLANGDTNGVNGHGSDNENGEYERHTNGHHDEDDMKMENGDMSEDETDKIFGVKQRGIWAGKKRRAEDAIDDDQPSTNGTHKRPKLAGSAKKKSEQLMRERLIHAEAHLRILSEDPHGFVKRMGKDWRVSLESLTHDFQQAEVENTVTARFGYLAASIVRILLAKGNLEEKQLANIAMVDPKDIRIGVGRLLQAGIIEEIEVPRDTNRSTSKAAYLCSYNPLRARRQILATTYKTMTRLLQRSDTEKEKIRMLVELSERSDIRTNRGLLSVPQREALKRWEDTEERILVQVGRCDDLVALMRDFVREEYIQKVEVENDMVVNRDSDSEEEVMMDEEILEEEEDAGGGEEFG